ncbi:unnamed protein product [Hermetia illucens]|uniref:L-xylulose reductase n=1 Tax=Hermetia illucens TaxID=343691 RepID=A0A7R8UDT3_HERIL|nr:L-xylulose reductase-like [Hermetia illucens]CAD7078863.1 unnamed protein product [Hermetia illucens]
MENDLKGKTILVTGAGLGIGNALCKRLHQLECKVIGVDKDAAQLEVLKKECPGTSTIAVDLSDWKKTKAALKDVEPLDGLANIAGVTIVKPFEEFTEEEFDFIFNVNIKGVFNVTQTLSPKLKDGAAVVNMSSQAARRALLGHTVYTASKAAVDYLSKSLALEFGPRKIRVNSLNPTAILTNMGRAVWSDPAKSGPLLNRIPLRRFGEVHEAVDALVFLLSNKSSYINGHSLPLEGGYSVA